ncbi:cytochrome P450 [Penicillium angulare]|uniref:cytochrome P450 n=1 Tax=Penicillium angulare TaxID=116970 RepID=UPI00253FE52A|nr:cytochrome P450 [Penicillium angulare]KAJ5263364.1 cytochrome P450 [Penicillium angulare]
MARFADSLAAVAGLSGVAFHVLLYRHGEWDLKAPEIVIKYAITLATLLTLDCLETLQKFEIDLNAGWSLKILVFHVVGVYSSMLLYRGALHRLNRFPGPIFARLSNFYVTFLSAKNFRLYEETEKLHQKYGDYVRIGPTELSIADPAAVAFIYSSKANVSKGPWYNCLEPRFSLQTDRDKASHAKRRKVWDQGFSTNALRDYEPRVVHYASQLIQKIQKHLNKPMDMTRWFNYYAIDVMGDLSFGKSFDMILDGKDKYFYTQLHADMKMIGLFSHLMWLFPFFKIIPLINADYLKFWGWLDDQVQHRRQNPPYRPDVFHWLIKAFEQGSKTEQDFLNLHGDTYLISVAGSDTTAATLSNVFFHIAKDSTLQDILRAELNENPDLFADQLSGIKLLNAVINETIRLHPVVPSGMQRMTPPEGLQIGNTYIPGDVLVATPMHTLFRDERVFQYSNEFKPERWTTHPELIKDSAAFIPFGGGPYACVGKQLALMEVRRVVAEILTRYEVSFADSFTPMELVFKNLPQN